jgi:hypothetical protein
MINCTKEAMNTANIPNGTFFQAVADPDRQCQLRLTPAFPSYQAFVGLTERIFCLPSFLRDKLRELWDAKDRRYLAVHDRAANMIYEGVVIDAWSSGPDGENVSLVMKNRGQTWLYHVNPENVESLHVVC